MIVQPKIAVEASSRMIPARTETIPGAGGDPLGAYSEVTIRAVAQRGSAEDDPVWDESGERGGPLTPEQQAVLLAANIPAVTEELKADAIEPLAEGAYAYARFPAAAACPTRRYVGSAPVGASVGSCFTV